MPAPSLGNREPGLWAPSLERRQMVTRLNSAFHFNIGNVFNSPLFMSLKKGEWRKRPTGNLLTKAQAAQKSRLYSFQVSFQPASRHFGGGGCLYIMTCQPPHWASFSPQSLSISQMRRPWPAEVQVSPLSKTPSEHLKPQIVLNLT